MVTLGDAITQARVYLDRALDDHRMRQLTIADPAASLRQALDDLALACGSATPSAPLPSAQLTHGETPGDDVRTDLGEARRITAWVLDQAKELRRPPGVEGAVSRLRERIGQSFDRLDRSASGLT